MNEARTSTAARVVAGSTLVVATALLGASLGLLWVRLFATRQATGWDAIAGALGGLIAGGFLGLLAGGALAAILSLRRQRGVAAFAGLATFGLVAGLIATAPKRETSSAPVPPRAFSPHFRIELRLGHTEEVLAGVSVGEDPLPFTEAVVWTATPELLRVGWGPGFSRCATVPSDADLVDLVPRVREAVAVAAEPDCRTPEDDLIVHFNWTLESATGGRGLEAGCLGDDPALLALVDAVAELAARRCPPPAG